MTAAACAIGVAVGGDPPATLDAAPMSRFQWGIAAVMVGLNALDGFDVLSISFASPGIAAGWGSTAPRSGSYCSFLPTPGSSQPGSRQASVAPPPRYSTTAQYFSVVVFAPMVGCLGLVAAAICAWRIHHPHRHPRLGEAERRHLTDGGALVALDAALQEGRRFDGASFRGNDRGRDQHRAPLLPPAG